MATSIKDIGDTQVKVGEWIVSVKYQPWSSLVELWFAQEVAGKVMIVHFTPTGEIELSEYTPSSTIPAPTMIVNADMWSGLRQAINGIEVTPDKQAVDAELKSTRYHLEDMRKLVFKEQS